MVHGGLGLVHSFDFDGLIVLLLQSAEGCGIWSAAGRGQDWRRRGPGSGSFTRRAAIARAASRFSLDIGEAFVSYRLTGFAVRASLWRDEKWTFGRRTAVE